MDELKQQIRDHYGEAAKAAQELAEAGQTTPASCCAPAGGSCCSSASSPSADLLDISQRLYSDDEEDEVPLEARLASLGCGNPVALAELRPGEIVLDLGSGGGIDVLLSARRVGPDGKAYGLDMTDEMLALARKNQRAAGVENVEFLKGDIEAVPLPDESVDVIISNCVVNLATDKDAVFREALRVLKPGGRFAVADIVFLGDVEAVPEALRRQVEAWAACIAGALGADEYVRRLTDAGFTTASAEVVTMYDTAAASGACCAEGIELPEGVGLASAFIRATKP